MGFRSRAKASHADEDARRAMTEGHTVYVHKVGIANVGSAGSTRAAPQYLGQPKSLRQSRRQAGIWSMWPHSPAT